MKVYSLFSLALLTALSPTTLGDEHHDRSEILNPRGNAHGKRNAQVAQAQAQAQDRGIDADTTTDELIATAFSSSTSQTATQKIPLNSGSANPSGVPEAASNYIKPGHRGPHFSYDKLYNLQTKFLDAFIYPNNQKEVSILKERVSDPMNMIC